MNICSNSTPVANNPCPDNWINEIPSYKFPATPELMEQLKHLTEPRQQKVAAVFLNIIDTVNAVIQEMKSFPPQRRFMGKKNRTPKGRIDKIFRKARMNQLLQLYLAKHCSIISTPIPKYPLGTTVGESGKEEIAYLSNGAKIKLQ
jgi:hypothetical protein